MKHEPIDSGAAKTGAPENAVHQAQASKTQSPTTIMPNDDTTQNIPAGQAACPQVRDDLLAYHHRELPFLRRLFVHGHLSRCADCQQELEKMSQIATVLQEAESQVANHLMNTPFETEAALQGNLSPASAEISSAMRAKILANLPDSDIPDAIHSEGTTRAPDAVSQERDSRPVDALLSPRRMPWIQWGAVAAITCVMASVLFPTFSRSRENARRASSQSNLKSIEMESQAERKEGALQKEAASAVAGAVRPSAAPAQSLNNDNPASPDIVVSGDIKTQRESRQVQEAFGRLAETEQRRTAIRSESKLKPTYKSEPANRIVVAESTAEKALKNRGALSPDLFRNGNTALTPYRRVHKEGALSVDVDGLEASSSAVESLIQNAGGFVANNDLSTGSNGLQSAQLEIRVPVKEFDAVIKSISALGKVRAKRVIGEDITAQVSDANEENNVVAGDLRFKLAQYQKAKERAASKKRAVPDDWQQRADIRRIRVELAQVRARLELLKKMSDFASLSVQLHEKTAATSGNGLTGEIGRTSQAAYQSFLLAARLPLNLLIYVLVYAPFWLPILLVWRHFARPYPRRTA